jgi:hypothetical protein
MRVQPHHYRFAFAKGPYAVVLMLDEPAGFEVIAARIPAYESLDAASEQAHRDSLEARWVWAGVIDLDGNVHDAYLAGVPGFPLGAINY